MLLLCDHASNRVPPGVDLGVSEAILNKHVAIDIGAAAVTRRLAAALDARAVLATVSRLVIDLHREADHAGLIPIVSDGHPVPGNREADRDGRIARFHDPYHAAVAAQIAQRRPAFIAAIHSFTPKLESGGDERPWQVGILYNQDDRAARIALGALERREIVAGDNQPYSGKLLNATLNRHAEAAGIACMSIEIRNDLISDDAGVAHWSGVIEEILTETGNSLASQGPSAT
ncbi:N-formylglutamate amidohydrolase [Stakelama sp. CBK3Z-3]|uniref:N-formylglutamate amidohydrolase n=2 Tax=Stakelama flava TaxID=2860338 RepID=A0ABS6XQ92_9SPHN|nr:N-formylglutamate amidohydrolase [Stakelama flava]